ncbi:DNA/RNA non-specific endonuclease [Pontibacter diazotrophicus]|uniref:DNA/RNA non-specific endonuclease n=1 Tax=Pontibacter diazotrophicus TaxID=1400979 RepID=A0A3D8L7B9_9BACT|nr:DNA/RNA non-specific endonuclease [Pontibacter diazotrophicus]RDV13310.1 DNA/RNA non-specific endonuclease [Pontibacter diazotrophicus]
MLKHTYRYFLLIFLFLSGCQDSEVAPQQALTLEEEQSLLGNPSGATADESNYNNYLMTKPQFALSYSRDRGTPNWVSWHVSRDWLGSAPRQNNFRADPELPQGWYRVTTSSYTGSGFDRGHSTPSADRTKSEEDNSATFLMTNIIPQAPNNNQETWANLEDYTRDLVQDGMEVYVVMGSYGVGGTGDNGTARTIDNGKVTVPNRIWKVLVVLEEGENDLQRINTGTRVIAVDTPNSNTVRPDWGTYRTTVDAIEQATGYDLLSALPVQVQQALESQMDTGPTR